MSINLELRYNGNTLIPTDMMGSRPQIEVVAINSDPEWFKKKKNKKQKTLKHNRRIRIYRDWEGKAFLLRETEEPTARVKGEIRYRFNTENYSTLPAALDWICNIQVEWEHQVANLRLGSKSKKLEGQVEVTSVRHGGVNIGKKIFTDTNGHENKYFKGKLMLKQL